jgi:mono/diheme cytochrome c family protein
MVEQGKAIWSRECITCHGTNARGTDTGPNLIRSETVNYDRSKPAEGYGTVLGPFLKKGHPTQSGKPSASFTDQEILQLAEFLSEKVSDTMRGSPTYIVLPENLLTGDAKAGEEFFKGQGTCVECHTSTTRSLAGIATRINNPQTLQAMVLYPATGGGRGGGGGGRGRGGAAPAGPLTPPAPNPLAVTTTITPPGGKPMTVTVTDEDSFYITFWNSDGELKTLKKTPSMKIVKDNPMQWHLDFSDRITDKQMHDLTAYLWSLK